MGRRSNVVPKTMSHPIQLHKNQRIERSTTRGNSIPLPLLTIHKRLTTGNKSTKSNLDRKQPLN